MRDERAGTTERALPAALARSPVTRRAAYAACIASWAADHRLSDPSDPPSLTHSPTHPPTGLLAGSDLTPHHLHCPLLPPFGHHRPCALPLRIHANSLLLQSIHVLCPPLASLHQFGIAAVWHCTSLALHQFGIAAV
jgi:hypothetical protein